MGNIKVDYASLETLAADINNSEKFYQDQIDTLESNCKKLFEGWGGNAAEFYGQQQDKINKDLQGLTETLNKIKVAIQAAKDSYHEGENRNASLFNS